MAVYVSVLRSLQNVGDKKLVVHQVSVDSSGDLNYTFVGSDLKVDSIFCTNPLPFIHEYGVLMLNEDRLWFVHIDDETSEARRVFEITQGPGRGARHQLGVDTLEALADLLRSEDRQAMAGEFAVEDHGADTWGLLYTPWSTSASEHELETASKAIRSAICNAPAFN